MMVSNTGFGSMIISEIDEKNELVLLSRLALVNDVFVIFLNMFLFGVQFHKEHRAMFTLESI